MMYSEFIERTGYGETYVTFADYSDFIEPAYMRLDVDKDKFCKKLYKLHAEKVYSAVNLVITGKSLSEKEDYICGDNSAFADVEKFHDLVKRGFLKELKRGNYDKKLG